jgi:hypothetical protein
MVPYFTVGCTLRSGRGEYRQKSVSGEQKTIKKKEILFPKLVEIFAI